MANVNEACGGLLYAPCVFMVEDGYQIVFVTRQPGMAWVRVCGEEYADDEIGLMRWYDTAHKVNVPRAALDEACGYEVCFASMEDRAPYYPAHGDVESRRFAFHPADGISRMCYIADTHGRIAEPVRCAKAMDLDNALIVFGGDIADHNSAAEDLHVHLRINDALTGGERPVLFSRGNHDTRGPAAHLLAGMMPLRDGRTYYTFAAGDTWGVVLDAGEDKPDDHIAYGSTIRFSRYRREQTEYLRRVRDSGKWRGAKRRIAICHVPFSMVQEEPFDIEQDIYREWVQLLNEMGVELLLCGHMHFAKVVRPGDEWDNWGQRFTTVIGSGLSDSGDVYAAAFVELSDAGVSAKFFDSECKESAESWGI